MVCSSMRLALLTDGDCPRTWPPRSMQRNVRPVLAVSPLGSTVIHESPGQPNPFAVRGAPVHVRRVVRVGGLGVGECPARRGPSMAREEASRENDASVFYAARCDAR